MVQLPYIIIFLSAPKEIQFMFVFQEIIVFCFLFFTFLYRLDGEVLGKSCSRQLEVVVRKKQRTLCLFLKNPDEKTMKVLCDGLTHSECTIETLE